MALTLVIGADDGAGRQCVSDMLSGEVLHRAADMHPRSQYDVMAQYPVPDMQNSAGMNKVFPGV